MITEKDLEMQYQSDTGNFATNNGKVNSGYTRGFYDWCLDQLLILKNQKDESSGKSQEFILSEGS